MDPERSNPTASKTRSIVRSTLAGFVDVCGWLVLISLVGYIGGKLANGPHPTVGRAGAGVVVVGILVVLVGAAFAYAKALRRGRTMGQRFARKGRPRRP